MNITIMVIILSALKRMLALWLAFVFLFSNTNASRGYKRELVVSKRLIGAHIRLTANLIRAS